MGGISSGVGLISGIDTDSLIQQILSVEARPSILAQRRLAQLQAQQAAYLDINTRLSGLQTASSSFRTQDTFGSAATSTTDETVLTATASAGAQVGSYSFVVDRLVSTQQELSRGFADSDVSGLNATSFTFETADALLERDVDLADLNGGAGIRRGEIQITDSAGASAAVDLSKVGTIGEVIDAINGSGLGVVAKAVGDGLVVDDTAGGGGTLTIADGTDSFAATDLGIAGSAVGTRIAGAALYRATEQTSLSLINGGTGIERTSTVGSGAFDFTVRVDSTDVKVSLGEIFEARDPDTDEVTTEAEAAVSTLGGVISRINSELQETLGEATTLSAELNADGTGLRIVDSAGTASIEVLDRGEETGGGATQSTAAQLGLAGSGTGSVEGSRIFGGLNSVLTKNLNGGSGVTGDGSLSITARDGSAFAVTGLTLDGSLSDIADEIEQQTGGAISVSIDDKGTGIVLTDTTGGGGNLIVTGTTGDDTAASLGIATDAAGVASDTVASGNLQRQYLGAGTLLSGLNGGDGVGTGSFTVRDATGAEATVNIGSAATTLSDVIDAINQTGLAIDARLNDQGDGI
ncbi:MAG: flagellar cap protein FliD N-terminal domain-containing protein, partial [Planctomycetota bacterium]